MFAFRHLRLTLAAVLVCGLARPAFADGAMGGLEALGQLIMVALVLLGLVVVALIARAILAARKSRDAERTGKAASSELPEARAMNERSPSGPKQ